MKEMQTHVAFAASGYLVELEDFPLPAELTEQPGGVLFDTANGQIIEASAKGPLSKTQIISFYRETLPQLGWDRLNDLVFRRDHEILHIYVDEKHQIVQFSLAPE